MWHYIYLYIHTCICMYICMYGWMYYRTLQQLFTKTGTSSKPTRIGGNYPKNTQSQPLREAKIYKKLTEVRMSNMFKLKNSVFSLEQ